MKLAKATFGSRNKDSNAISVAWTGRISEFHPSVQVS